jgi:cell division cycle 20-like protein 1 (cofactor of APC complex)
LNDLLRSELLNENSDPNPSASPSQRGNNSGSTSSRGGSNFFRFESPRSNYTRNVFAENPTSVVNAFNLSPVGSASSQRLLATPQKRKRRIAKVPFKVLDAPALQDDFYLNLVDW